jgi:DNA invertase Pin-like site-specific DNA recombinase
MLSVIAYVRVSTNKQAEYGISLDAQRKQIKVFGKSKGLRIRKWITETGSARNEENGSVRPGFKEATELALEKEWPIIVATPDRFSRTIDSFARFHERGGKVYSTDIGFGEDDAVMSAKIARAQETGNFIGQRTKEGQKRAKAAGTLGNPDFGAVRAKGNKARHELARLRQEEFRPRRERALEQGAKTDAQVAKAFNDSGYATARGLPWTADNVAKIRRDLITFDKVRVSIETPPARKPAPLFTSDNRLTKEGLRRFLDALTILGIDHGTMTRLDEAVLSEAQMKKVREKIEKAEVEQIARDVCEGTCSLSMTAKVVLEDRWGLF